MGSQRWLLAYYHVEPATFFAIGGPQGVPHLLLKGGPAAAAVGGMLGVLGARGQPRWQGLLEC